jgi:hypothetical protein
MQMERITICPAAGLPSLEELESSELHSSPTARPLGALWKLMDQNPKRGTVVRLRASEEPIKRDIQ